jgi:hypothetical protein
MRRFLSGPYRNKGKHAIILPRTCCFLMCVCYAALCVSVGHTGHTLQVPCCSLRSARSDVTASVQLVSVCHTGHTLQVPCPSLGPGPSDVTASFQHAAVVHVLMHRTHDSALKRLCVGIPAHLLLSHCVAIALVLLLVKGFLARGSRAMLQAGRLWAFFGRTVRNR